MWPSPRQRQLASIDLPAAVLLILCLAIPVGRTQSSVALRGIVTDQINAVISDALVGLYSTDRVLQTKSNRTGQFEFVNAPSGTYELEAASPGFQSQKIEGIRIPKNDAEVISIKLLVASQPSDCGKGPSATYEKASVDGPLLTGLVRGSSGQSLPGFKIRLSKIGRPKVLASQHSDERGEFQFRGVEPGQYVLSASHNGYRDPWSERFWITRENNTRIIFQPIKGTGIILCQ
jgi:carboxypeptidase family protein